MVGYPHDIKGQGIYAYVTLMTGVEPSDELRKELVAWVRKDIGPIASPDLIQFAPGLPKTRSGKIMRRILRKIAEDELVQPRRHHDARRSCRGRRSRQEPSEQKGRRGSVGRLNCHNRNMPPPRGCGEDEVVIGSPTQFARSIPHRKRAACGWRGLD